LARHWSSSSTLRLLRSRCKSGGACACSHAIPCVTCERHLGSEGCMRRMRPSVQKRERPFLDRDAAKGPTHARPAAWPRRHRTPPPSRALLRGHYLLRHAFPVVVPREHVGLVGERGHQVAVGAELERDRERLLQRADERADAGVPHAAAPQALQAPGSFFFLKKGRGLMVGEGGRRKL
jgi:hypothetical protein